MMKKYFKHLAVLLVLNIFLPHAMLAMEKGSHHQSSSSSYNPEQAAPTTLSEVSILARKIGQNIDSNPRVPKYQGKPTENSLIAIAKMELMHCTSRSVTEYGAKTCFNTDNSGILKDIYNAVEQHPDECIVAADQYYLIKVVNSNDVGLGSQPLGYKSHTDQSPLARVMISLGGIQTSGHWNISKARIVSVYLITDEEYEKLKLRASKHITS